MEEKGSGCLQPAPSVPAIELLRSRGYDVEVYPGPDAPARELLLEKVRTGIDGLITTLRDRSMPRSSRQGREPSGASRNSPSALTTSTAPTPTATRIPFTNTADVLTDATAEFAFAILMDVSRKLWSSERLVRENRWAFWHPYLPFLGDEITGKTIAVIGTGRIGQALIAKCSGFEMNVLCYDAEYRNEKFAASMQKVMELKARARHFPPQELDSLRGLDECLREADYVSLHVPLLREGEAKAPTWHLINERTLQEMKKSAYLVNTSRGPVVDENALAKALREGWIAGAAIDVFEREPLPADSPLRDPAIEDRCRLFHHFASGGVATRLSPDPNMWHGGPLCAGNDRYAGGQRLYQNALRRE
jgi:glyoxylate reductase